MCEKHLTCSLCFFTGLKFFLNNISFHAINFSDVVLDSKDSTKARCVELLKEGIRSCVVKPLPRTVFQRDEIEKVFRYMGRGTHIGKILVKVSDLFLHFKFVS